MKTEVTFYLVWGDLPNGGFDEGFHKRLPQRDTEVRGSIMGVKMRNPWIRDRR
jgi:hypothetical protein